MTQEQWILGYLIIHMVCVIDIFETMKAHDYEPQPIEKVFVWLSAPGILLTIFINMLRRNK